LVEKGLKCDIQDSAVRSELFYDSLYFTQEIELTGLEIGRVGHFVIYFLGANTSGTPMLAAARSKS
jgi:hypothetical protein